MRRHFASTEAGQQHWEIWCSWASWHRTVFLRCFTTAPSLPSVSLPSWISFAFFVMPSSSSHSYRGYFLPFEGNQSVSFPALLLTFPPPGGEHSLGSNLTKWSKAAILKAKEGTPRASIGSREGSIFSSPLSSSQEAQYSHGWLMAQQWALCFHTLPKPKQGGGSSSEWRMALLAFTLWNISICDTFIEHLFLSHALW